MVQGEEVSQATGYPLAMEPQGKVRSAGHARRAEQARLRHCPVALQVPRW